MAKDDLSLGVELGKLEIEPLKLNKSSSDENPFMCPALSQNKKNLFAKIISQTSKCSCERQEKSITMPICKKKQVKILKEPILKILQDKNKNKNEHQQILSGKCSSVGNPNSTDILNLCALVDNCNQLKISSGSNEQNVATDMENESQWWKSTRRQNKTKQNKDPVPGRSQPGSCSQEALNPPCDVTIDELASYFETLVHIPKKMSSMAEMMYI